MKIGDSIHFAIALRALGQPDPLTVAAFAPSEHVRHRDAWATSDYQVYRSATLFQRGIALAVGHVVLQGIGKSYSLSPRMPK